MKMLFSIYKLDEPGVEHKPWVIVLVEESYWKSYHHGVHSFRDYSPPARAKIVSLTQKDFFGELMEGIYEPYDGTLGKRELQKLMLA